MFIIWLFVESSVQYKWGYCAKCCPAWADAWFDTFILTLLLLAMSHMSFSLRMCSFLWFSNHEFWTSGSYQGWHLPFDLYSCSTLHSPMRCDNSSLILKSQGPNCKISHGSTSDSKSIVAQMEAILPRTSHLFDRPLRRIQIGSLARLHKD